MEQVISIFINGVLGVFAGMAVLYITMKLAVLLPHSRDKDE